MSYFKESPLWGSARGFWQSIWNDGPQFLFAGGGGIRDHRVLPLAEHERGDAIQLNKITQMADNFSRRSCVGIGFTDFARWVLIHQLLPVARVRTSPVHAAGMCGGIVIAAGGDDAVPVPAPYGHFGRWYLVSVSSG